MVNKLRKSAEKSEDQAVIAETKGLLERWKALTTAAIAAPAKRTRPEVAEVSAKRHAALSKTKARPVWPGCQRRRRG